MTPVLETSGLSVGFRTGYGYVRALSDATFSVDRGQILVVIGESGSGKTVLAQALMRMLPMNAEVTGSVRLSGDELTTLNEKDMRAVRGRRIALIPQGVGTALNPVRKTGPLLLELAGARGIARNGARERLSEVLADVGLQWDQVADRYPHQLSGGMQQRVVNALAMVGEPELVLADEPTHGLDPELVDTTAGHLRTIADRGAALLVITHDLRLAERLGGRVALVYASYIVELESSEAFFREPAHPYGRALLDALPERGGTPIPGLSVELTALPPGCPFAPRCMHREERCEPAVPQATALVEPRAFARCVLHA